MLQFIVKKNHWARSQEIRMLTPFSHTAGVRPCACPLPALSFLYDSYRLSSYRVCVLVSFFHRAVASLNTPFIPANPTVSPMERIKANPVFDYQLYFQEPVSLGL